MWAFYFAVDLNWSRVDAGKISEANARIHKAILKLYKQILKQVNHQVGYVDFHAVFSRFKMDGVP